MKVVTTSDFEKQLVRLPASVQRFCDIQLAHFTSNDMLMMFNDAVENKNPELRGHVEKQFQRYLDKRPSRK